MYSTQLWISSGEFHCIACGWRASHEKHRFAYYRKWFYSFGPQLLVHIGGNTHLWGYGKCPQCKASKTITLKMHKKSSSP
jgi:hypothetical protein